MEFLWLLLTTFLCCLWWCPGSEADPDKICVVGGGLTGLVVSHVLSEWLDECPCYGTELRLFERNPAEFGGKLGTVYSTGTYDYRWPDLLYYNVWEKGPIMFTEDDGLILKYLNKTNLNYLVRWECRNFAAFDPESEATIMMENLVPSNAVDPLTAAIKKYQKLREAYDPYWFTPFGFAKIHIYKDWAPELFLTAADWLTIHDLNILDPLMAIGFTCEGYGDLATLPALYMLKALTPALAWRLLRLPVAPINDPSTQVVTVGSSGFGEFARRLSTRTQNRTLGADLVHLKRGRDDGLIKLKFSRGKGTHHEHVHCSRVVLAFPPLLSTIGRIMDDLTFEEKELLDAVRVHKYVSSGHIVKASGNRYVYVGILNGTTPGMGPQGNGGPIAVVRSGKNYIDGSLAATVYSWIYGKFTSGPDKADLDLVQEKLWPFLEKFNSFPPGGENPFIHGWEYFPHVSNVSIADGFFGKFDANQGRGGLFYASPLITFETMETAIEAAEYIAGKVWGSLPVPQACYDQNQCVLTTVSPATATTTKNK